MESEHSWRLSKIEAFYKRFALCPAYDMLLSPLNMGLLFPVPQKKYILKI